MFKKQIIVFMVMLAMLTGCSRFFFRPNETSDGNLIELSYTAVDQLLLHLPQPLPRGSVVVINSLINVNDLGQSLSFGRIVSEQISSAFQLNGYRVMGMELPTEVFVKNEAGILQLPEKTKEALTAIGATVIVIGSYAPGRNNVYVSLRMVDFSNQTIVSSTDYQVAMGPDAKALVMPPPQAQSQK